MQNRFLNASLTVACTLLAIALVRHGMPQRIGRSDVAATTTSAWPTVDEDLALLNQPIDRVRMENVTLENAIRDLAVQTHVNVCADWPDLERAGLSRTRRLSIELNHVTLHQALSAALMRVPEPGVDPRVIVSNGVVIVTRKEMESSYLRTECFNIRSLIEELQGGVRHVRECRTGAQQSDTSDPANSEANPQPGTIDPAVSDEIASIISRFITETIAPDTWADAGGGRGSIREISQILIVTQSTENVAAVARLLRQLHEGLHANNLPLISYVVAPTTIPSDGSDSPAPVTQFINLQPLIEKLQTEKVWPTTSPADRELKTQGEILDEIVKLLADTVDPDSWHIELGRNCGIHTFGPIMAITQTPANLRAVRLTLENLFRATSANDFLSATQPSAATTRESNPK